MKTLFNHLLVLLFLFIFLFIFICLLLLLLKAVTTSQLIKDNNYQLMRGMFCYYSCAIPNSNIKFAFDSTHSLPLEFWFQTGAPAPWGLDSFAIS